jgi:hypothetical protein
MTSKEISSIINDLKHLKLSIEPDKKWKNKVLDASILYAIQHIGPEGGTSKEISDILSEPERVISRLVSPMFNSTIIADYLIRTGSSNKFTYIGTDKLKQENIINVNELIHTTKVKKRRASSKSVKKGEKVLPFKRKNQNVVHAIVVLGGKKGITVEGISIILGMTYKKVESELNSWKDNPMEKLFRCVKSDKGRKYDRYYPPGIKELTSIGGPAYYRDCKHKIDPEEARKLVVKNVNNGTLSIEIINGIVIIKPT